MTRQPAARAGRLRCGPGRDECARSPRAARRRLRARDGAKSSLAPSAGGWSHACSVLPWHRGSIFRDPWSRYPLACCRLARYVEAEPCLVAGRISQREAACPSEVLPSLQTTCTPRGVASKTRDWRGDTVFISSRPQSSAGLPSRCSMLDAEAGERRARRSRRGVVGSRGR